MFFLLPLLAVAQDVDSDEDGLTDPVEAQLGTDPFDADTDNDGLLDGEEVGLGTDPRDADTDDDGLSDGEEVLHYATDPVLADTDGGGVLDGEEHLLETDPLDPLDDVAATSGAFNGGCVNGCGASSASPALFRWLARR